MMFQWLFSYFSETRKLAYLKKRGIVLGTRIRGGRKVYLYMVNDFFVEIIYKDDNVHHEAEYLETFSNLTNLNSYLESEFKRAF